MTLPGLEPLTRTDNWFWTGGYVFNVSAYGILGVAHGGTPVDESTALLALLTIVYNAGGGTIVFNGRTYRFDSSWLFPNSGGGTPTQPPIRITGSGGGASIQQVTLDGTVIDLRYNGANSKIDTRGFGNLEIDHLNLIDAGSSSSVPFIQTTNTTIRVHDNQFVGNTPNTPTQDAIILGGTTTAITGNFNSAFQGYGTVIEKNTFNNIQRGVYVRTYGNGVIIKDNTWGIHSAGTAAIEFDAGSDTNSGNVIIHNLIEAGAYLYTLQTTGTFIGNTVGPNLIFDDSGSTLAAYHLQSGAEYNLIIAGMNSDATPLVIEAGTAIGKNTIITAHQDQASLFSQPTHFTNGDVAIIGDNLGLTTQNIAGDKWLQRISPSPSGGLLTWLHTPSGGSAESILQLQRISSSDARAFLGGSSNNVIFAASNLQVWAATGASLLLGTAAAPDVQVLGASGTTLNKGVSIAGTGVKHGRVTTGSIGTLARADVTLTWAGTAFADTNYSVSCAVMETSGSGTGLRVERIRSKSTTAIVVQVMNDSGGSLTGTLEAVAFHD